MLTNTVGITHGVGHLNLPLLLLAPLVLEPDSNDPCLESRHLYQLVLGESVRPRVQVETRSEIHIHCCYGKSSSYIKRNPSYFPDSFIFHCYLENSFWRYIKQSRRYFFIRLRIFHRRSFSTELSFKIIVTVLL